MLYYLWPTGFALLGKKINFAFQGQAQSIQGRPREKSKKTPEIKRGYRYDITHQPAYTQVSAMLAKSILDEALQRV